MGSDLSKPRTKKDCLDKKCSMSEHCLYTCANPPNANCPNTKPICSSRLKKKIEKHMHQKCKNLGLDVTDIMKRDPLYANCCPMPPPPLPCPPLGGPCFMPCPPSTPPPPPPPPPPCCPKTLRPMMRQSCPNEVRDPCLSREPSLGPITPCGQRTPQLIPPIPPPQGPPPPQYFFPEPCPSEKYAPRSGRYKTSRPACRRGDEEIFVETYEIHEPVKESTRHYSVTAKHYPVLYENFDKIKVPNECDIIPNDRVYEIRKEKILIRTDKNSESPPRIRSKSSDRCLDSKSVRILDPDGCFDPDYDPSLSGKRQLQSRSGYYLSGSQLSKSNFEDRSLVNCCDNSANYSTAERSVHRNYDDYSKRSESRHGYRNKYRYVVDDNYENGCDDYSSSRSLKRASGENSSSKQNLLNSNSPPSGGNPSGAGGANGAICNNDIVYVPMVKEHFIQRESAKLGVNCNDLLSPCSEQTRNGDASLVFLKQSNDKYKPNKSTEYLNTSSKFISNSSYNYNNSHSHSNRKNKTEYSTFDDDLSPRTTTTQTKNIKFSLEDNSKSYINQDEPICADVITSYDCEGLKYSNSSLSKVASAFTIPVKPIIKSSSKSTHSISAVSANMTPIYTNMNGLTTSMNSNLANGGGNGCPNGSSGGGATYIYLSDTCRSREPSPVLRTKSGSNSSSTSQSYSARSDSNEGKSTTATVYITPPATNISTTLASSIKTPRTSSPKMMRPLMSNSATNLSCTGTSTQAQFPSSKIQLIDSILKQIDSTSAAPSKTVRL